MFVKVLNNVITDWPYSFANLQSDYANTSFPPNPDYDTLSEFNVYKYIRVDMPSYDLLTQYLEEIKPTLVNGKWTQKWEVKNLSASMASDNIRQKRNSLLGETDYHALSDQTLSSEMNTYRQKLRDITSQSGFPFSVTWPTKPS